MMITQAWMTASLVRAGKKFPGLKTLLRDEPQRSKQPQNWESQLNIARAWHAAANRKK